MSIGSFAELVDDGGVPWVVVEKMEMKFGEVLVEVGIVVEVTICGLRSEGKCCDLWLC